jgi:preprotein translocase subunit YajC
MGTIFLAASTKPASGGSPLFLIGLVVVIGLFFLMTRNQRNRQRRAAAVQNQAMPGQRVVTTAGMYGTVVSGDDKDVVIEFAPGVQVTMLRRAIMQVVPEDAAVADAGPSPDGRVETSLADGDGAGGTGGSGSPDQHDHEESDL